jgi:hypothetical protein
MILTMPKRWIFDLSDPRTVLLATVLILVGGTYPALHFWAQGEGFAPVFAAIWIVGSIGQLVWAVIKYARWRSTQDR